MRFVAEGPSLPDELLMARDAGQVLFFCGAGVSQAEAWLPNFAKLAEKVLALLGSALDSPARRLFNASQAFEEASGLTGLVATDRIFGMLEREFEPAEVREAVAIALKPETVYGLGAHQTLLDLSRTRAGVARLVTTNFDLLFEECDPGVGSFNPPHLPDPRRERDFRGIIHIHGRVDPDYRRACDDEFVLSSADFGRAYLADGWATRYIQTLLQRFKIVFVGYSADDPPVQYLLEALNRSKDPRNELYAFQSGDTAEASAQWAHKGVLPIPYDSADHHAASWNTLRAWADRARDVDGWHDRLIASASAGPDTLRPYQRGIIAHLASTRAGAKRLATTADPIPASWLCVMDPRRRYGQAGPVDMYDEASTRFDPFDAFGLDSDEAPTPTDPANRFTRRAVPDDAWDGFVSTETDREHLSHEGTGQIRGDGADQAAALPPRLWHLGMYLVRIAEQPAALWWAAHQSRLHPHIQQRVEWSLRNEPARFSPVVREGWRLLLAAWRQRGRDANYSRYEIEARARQEGWSTRLIREAVAMYRPTLSIEAPYSAGVPAYTAEIRLNQILRADVEYPRPHEALTIPSEHLTYAVGLFRQLIEHAIVLEREVRGRDLIYFDTTRPDDGKQLDEDGFRLTGHLATFTKMVARLAAEDRLAARAEFERWPAHTNEVFTRLRIWAAGRPELLTSNEAAEVFLSLDEESFWSDQHERDLLYALRDRWPEMPSDEVRRIEGRLRNGHFPWREKREDSDRVNAYYRLNRLQWLGSRGVQFTFNIDAEIVAQRADAPDWEARFGDNAARPQVGEVQNIKIDTNPKPLVDLPIGEVLSAVRALSHRNFDSNVERRPFRGFAETWPVRALAVLADAARQGEFDQQSWTAMLYAKGKAETSPRLLTAIGQRLARLSPEQIATIAHPVSEWLRERGELLLAELPHIFDLVWNAMIVALTAHPPAERFRRPDEGWVDDGLNQPVGRMVDAMLRDPTKREFHFGAGLPEDWIRRFNQVLDLPGDGRRHAIAMISPHLNWLYDIAPEWAEQKLVVLAERTDSDSQAFWGGYFWGGRTPQLPLYIRLKTAFIALASAGTQRRDHANKLAPMLLAGWGGDGDSPEPERLIPNIELREILIHADDDLRTQMLRHLERWSSEPKSRWGERLIPFLRDVWPRQSAVRTPRVAGRLADLALAFPDRFPEIVDTILPRLGPIKGAAVRIGPFLDIETGIAAKHPKPLLDLLWIILSEDPTDWPFETSNTKGR